MTTIKEVAAEAGVSTATVSRVLANKPHIKKELQEKVYNAVKKLNYRPNHIARNLRNRQSSTIGIIVADLGNPFFSLISREIEKAAYAKGMAVLLFNSDEDPNKEAICLELLKDERVSGAIIAPTSKTANSTTKRIDIGIPIVAINRKIQSMDVDSVLIDNFNSAYNLTCHLADDGYRRIGGIFSLDNSTIRARYEGFRKALQDRSIQPVPELELMNNTTEEDGYRAAETLLGMRERPEVIFAANGIIATGAFRNLIDNRIRIPEDIGFVCFDEQAWTPLVNPKITVVKQPTYEIGKTAIELLFSRIAEPDRPIRDIILRGEIIIRGSCKKAGSHAHDSILTDRNCHFGYFSVLRRNSAVTPNYDCFLSPNN